MGHLFRNTHPFGGGGGGGGCDVPLVEFLYHVETRILWGGGGGGGGNVPLVEFLDHVETCMPGESYRR